MREIGSAAMPIIPVFGKGLKADLERGMGGSLDKAGASGGRRFGDAAGRELTASLGKHAKRAALVASGALLATGAVAFKIGADSVNLAADLEQSIGAVDTVFGKSSKTIHAWATGAARDVGLSENAYNELASLIGTQLKNAGTSMAKLAPKTDRLIDLGADLSSMFGGTTAEAVAALSSALKGERDPIEKYGVSLNEAAIKAEALSSGIIKARVDSFDLKQATLKMTIAQAGYNKQVAEHGKNSIEAAKAEATLGAATKKFNEVSSGKVDELTAQQKQAATLALIYKQTADASGNFGRESDTLSHKQQVLKANLENTKAEIGTALLPIMADAADFLLDEGVPAFQKFADWFGDEGVPALQGFGREMKPIAEEVLPAVGNAIKDIGGFLKTAAPYAKDVVEAFNDMPDWAKKGLALGGAGLVVKNKLTGAEGLLGGKGGTPATPLYVWTVNGGAGLPGGGGKPGGKGGGILGFGISSLLAIAGGQVLLDNGPKLATGLQTAKGPTSSSAEEIRKALEDSDVGKYAEKLGIDLDRLAAGLSTQGARSREFQDAVTKLEQTNDGAWEHINELIPVVGSWITTNGDQAAFALKDLKAIVEDLNVGLGNLLAGNPDGADMPKDVTGLYAKIPDAKLKVLQDPETIKTRGDVRELLKNVDGLTKNDYKVLFNILGLSKAKTDAGTLLGYMRELTGMTPPKVPSVPQGFNGPFRSAGASRFTPFSIGNVNIQGSTADRLIAELQDINRRQSAGGF